ncbi:MAG: hypothetical protein ACLFPE_12755 [Bacteroidales bacterium]
MENVILVLVITLAVLIVIFLIFREIVCWYWKINERIKLQYKTNWLLEKISIQLGAANLDEITVEVKETGKIKKLTMDQWIQYNMKYPGQKKISIINEEQLQKKEATL